MKITKLTTLCLSRLHERERQWITARYRTIKADCAIVVIETDDGSTGIGEASAYGWPSQIAGWVEWLSPLLVGKDPSDPSIAPRPNGRGRAYDCAAAGIDCALWDLRGKIAGRRVSELLAKPSQRTPPERVRLYASSGCGYDWGVRPAALIDQALQHIDEGYTAMKFRIGTEWAWNGVTVERFVDLMRALTKAVDGRMELMLDGNQRLTEEEALMIARVLDELRFAWFEEPIPQTDVEGYARLNAAVEMPITGGEQFATVEQFRPYLERRAYDIVQPDAGICGLTELMQIAEMADRYGIGFCPHSWHNGLMAMAHAHAVAAAPQPSAAPFERGRVGSVVELNQHQGPLTWEILAEKPQIKEGFLHLPDAPGLGVELAEGLSERFPHVEGHYAVVVER